jgi:signal transduction histidine kinase
VRSLRARLLLGAGALCLLAVVAVAVAARQGARIEVHQFLQLEAVDRREEAQRALVAIATAHPRGLSAAQLPEAAARLPPGFGLFLLDDRQRLVGAAGPELRSSMVAVEARGESLRLTVTREAGDRAELMLRGGGVDVLIAGAATGSEATEGAGSRGTLHVLPLPTARVGPARADAMLGALDRRLVGATAAVGAFALLLTAAFAHRLLVPIRELQRAARDLAAGDRGRRVAIVRDDEIGDLARAFDRMAEELERQERLRRDLVADVAHELRAPLTALRCRLEAAQDGLERDPAAALGALHHDVLHLARLVDDLQELALADAGQLRIDVAPTELAPVVESAARAAGLAGDPRLRLEVGAGRLQADPVRLRQVLVNLLTNAARHTPPAGSIRVVAVVEGAEVRVEVVDTGHGLTSEQLERVFQRFYRTDPSRQRETGGTGLGLAIVRSLVVVQGGRVWARAEPGAGAVFGFALPSAPMPITPATPAARTT